eukprot:138413_1
MFFHPHHPTEAIPLHKLFQSLALTGNGKMHLVTVPVGQHGQVVGYSSKISLFARIKAVCKSIVGLSPKTPSSGEAHAMHIVTLPSAAIKVHLRMTHPPAHGAPAFAMHMM